MALERIALGRIFFPASLIPVFLLILASRTSYGASVGAVSSFSGVVELLPAGSRDWTPAKKGAPLSAGDRVRTGGNGRVLLEFSDGTRLTLGNDTSLEITEFLLKKKKRSALFSLSTGKLRAVIGKFTGKTDIKVKTPTSTSGVKGTDFIVMNRGDANVVFGKDGTVAVSGGADRGVLLGEGAMTENTRGTEPIEPVKVEPSTPLHEARAELESVTDVDAPVEWEKAGMVPLILARWNINYGHYLADSRRFKEALDVFKVAVDLTDSGKLKAEAHIERATVYSRNLGDPARALSEYNEVIGKYPEEPFLENALFSSGMAKMELGDTAGALELFREYSRKYPDGRHRESVEIFINAIERALEKD